MQLDLAPEWTMELERGPDWLFIRLRPPREGDTVEIPLADKILKQLEQAFCHRLVLEMDEVHLLRSWTLAELIRLQKGIAAQGGTLRLCGLSEHNERILRICRLLDRFPAFANRHDAVMGCNPRKPR
jgi:anti-anti-sigma factor